METIAVEGRGTIFAIRIPDPSGSGYDIFRPAAPLPKPTVTWSNGTRVGCTANPKVAEIFLGNRFLQSAYRPFDGPTGGGNARNRDEVAKREIRPAAMSDCYKPRCWKQWRGVQHRSS